MNDLPLGKRLLFWAIVLALPLLVLLAAVEVYFLYGYLSYPVSYCRSFAQIDAEAGWVLRPNTESCIRGRAGAFGPPAFEAETTIDAAGGRTVPAPDPARRDAGADPDPAPVLVMGDSWSFGYGIDDDETFAARLAARYGVPSALHASPAYSGAQALVLGRRAAARIAPRAIVYLELGFWERGVCDGAARPARILKPCYWVDGDGVVELVLPAPGFVEAAAGFGYLPGGMVGAGEKTLAYFLIARPLSMLNELLVRLGLASGFPDDFRAGVSAEEQAAIRAAHFANLAELARRRDARLILIDPDGVYADAYRSGQDEAADIRYVDAARWDEVVARPMKTLPADSARVPHDGHYGPGAHELIAALVRAELPPYE